MTEQKAEQLEEQYNNFVELLKNNYPLEKLSSLFVHDIMGYGANLDEKIFNLNELYEGFRIQKEQSVGLDIQFGIMPISRRISHGENVAIYVDEIKLMMTVEGVKHENDLRLSIPFEFIDERWLCTHFHASYGLVVTGDAWAIELMKEKNEELQRMVDERTIQLQNSLLELKATQAQLIQSEKLASLGELTAGIAHEIQNPLNFVNNFSELSVDLVKDLKEEIEKPTQDKEYIGELFDDLSQNQEKINHHGKRASSIVKGMLEHSRASTGVKELTDINKLADEYLRLSYHGLRAKDNTFNADYELIVDENLPKIEVIPQDIGRVLLNLINNAFYAVNERADQIRSGNFESFPNVKAEQSNYTPSVTVTTQQLDNQIIIKVKDNGIGMSEATKAKVFQPFFTTKPTGQGTGLGLSLAYDIVTKGHGGTLEVESTDGTSRDNREGVGSEFIITLPFKTNG